MDLTNSGYRFYKIGQGKKWHVVFLDGLHSLCGCGPIRLTDGMEIEGVPDEKVCRRCAAWLEGAEVGKH